MVGILNLKLQFPILIYMQYQVKSITQNILSKIMVSITDHLRLK